MLGAAEHFAKRCGLDEITTTGITKVAALEDGKIRTFELSPADFGVSPCVLADIKGGD
ncbi:hypothetical protein AB9F45_39815, partial [Rhizobium leguminosarum]